MLSSSLKERLALSSLAAGAMCVVVIRACLQSITLDEAASFLGFAVTPWPAHWWPSSDNHVLNSMLMRLSATIFGVNNLSARLPAVLGAAIYIGSAIFLSLKLADRKLLQALFFTCLVYNPMILDYLVAARGYSLAIGFLLAALSLIASAMLADGIDPRALRRKTAWVSILLALSCSANFSFAIANGTLLTLFFIWAAGRKRFATSESMRLAAFAYLPGLSAGFLLCGSTVLHWPKGELYFGSKSMSQMWGGFATGIFDELNPNLVNPLLLPWLSGLRSFLPWLTVLAACHFLDSWRSITGASRIQSPTA